MNFTTAIASIVLSLSGMQPGDDPNSCQFENTPTIWQIDIDGTPLLQYPSIGGLPANVYGCCESFRVLMPVYNQGTYQIQRRCQPATNWTTLQTIVVDSDDVLDDTALNLTYVLSLGAFTQACEADCLYRVIRIFGPGTPDWIIGQFRVTCISVDCP